MSTRPRSRRRRRRAWHRLLLLVPLAAVFVAGIGLGEALHDNPSTGGTQTVIRTLKPLNLPPLATETGMVTTSNH